MERNINDIESKLHSELNRIRCDAEGFAWHANRDAIREAYELGVKDASENTELRLLLGKALDVIQGPGHDFRRQDRKRACLLADREFSPYSITDGREDE